MTNLREAMQMALDALDSDNPDIQLRAATHLRAALAQPQQEPINYEEWNYDPMTGKPLWDKQPEQEPVAWSVTYHGIHCNNMFNDQILAENELRRLDEECGSAARTIVPLYTAPPQREWQGLTGEEIVSLIRANQIFDFSIDHGNTPDWIVIDFVRKAESLLREKNT